MPERSKPDCAKFDKRPPVFQQGFSLIELAIVMLIVGTLLGGIFVSLASTMENNRRTETRALLLQVTEALYGFAQVHGRLPCPATVASAGYESPLTGGTCTTYHGFVPSVTLGVFGSSNDDGLLVDAWQNPLRYSVAVTNQPDGGFTSALDMVTLFNSPPLTASAPLLRVCDNSACNNIVNSDTAPAVILSMGANWVDYSGASSTAEQANAGGAADGVYPLTNTNDFVSAPYAEDSYDDLVVWLSPQILFSRLITAGQLP